MSYLTHQGVSQELMPLEIPPKLGTYPNTIESSSNQNNQPLVAKLRTSGRLAAQRVQKAIKRTAEDLDESTLEGSSKRVHLDTGEGSESSQSDISQYVADTVSENTHNDSMQTIVVSLAGAGTTSRPKTKVQTIETPLTRPPAAGKPLVWANTRGSLCEALPYFRAFKGSLHSADLVCQGFLIDQEVDQRDVFGSQVIISSVGGGRVKDPETGNMVRSHDASDTASNIRAIINAYRNKSLVAEKQISKRNSKAVTAWRIRFEKADLAEPSWWTPETDEIGISNNTVVKASVTICKKCNTPSKEIFTTGWLCLNHKCEQYFVSTTGLAVDLEGLAYTEAFLSERTSFEGRIPSIKPSVPLSDGLHGTELALRRGFVCPDCGCCNRRVYWNRWLCENERCHYTRDAPMLPYPKALLRKENEEFDNRMSKRRTRYGVNENTLCQDVYLHDPFATIYQRGYLQFSQTLTLGGIFSASREVISKPNGPDDLFRTLELTDIGLRRNPAAVVGHKLEGYTRHFQQNFGARYKFGVTVQSKGFSEAPDAILRALQRLIWAKQVSVEQSNTFVNALDQKYVGEHAIVLNSGDFNELLALGYMEDDKINYHDDGERELGPVVAALSLGSPSTMRFRPKRNTGFFLPTQQVQGRTCYKEVLEVTMKHGDMMVMIGTEIQKVYEHTVEPYGKRRFSLTARYIDPEKMESQEDRDDAAVKGAIPEHAKAFVYDGF
ncbi:hypothetical protein P885DRAFT_33104 [Corynascus similis CBS 632.67]